MAITASEARKSLFPLIEQVNNDHTAIEITSKKGNAVLLSREDYDAMQETAYLLRSPANAAWLMQSIAQARLGQVGEHELDERP
ncbi:MAG: type II toxin-antitoxin system Phd/YefM family antitoxin [Pseudonocardiaceae bacterium]